ncbi:MAG: DUF177 domain-containing protein [Prevotellaceae bacterium]|jgi:uncharacterized metal-binding protein YceD (DUF177 family)|nr:DUF177 domain-containing protein [Prevotellaceae bacterium]
MSKFELYNLPLKDLTETTAVFKYDLDDAFFKKIDSPEAEKGNIKAIVSAKKRNTDFELTVELNGYVTLPCDRCLDDMQQPIQHKETLLAKLGAAFGEDGETVIVPETDGFINLAWFFYEMIVVNIPIKHVHASGECNKTMQQKLRKHSVHSLEDADEMPDIDDFDDDFSSDDSTDIDPRWEKLKDI